MSKDGAYALLGLVITVGFGCIAWWGVYKLVTQAMQVLSHLS